MLLDPRGMDTPMEFAETTIRAFTHPPKRWRRWALWSSFLVPAAVGYAFGRRSRPLGLAAGLGGAAALALVRWQMARWFTDQPPYEVERRIGSIEIRRYPSQLAVRTRIDTPDLRRALDRGFERLLAYIVGANQWAERFPMYSPVTTESERLVPDAIPGESRDPAFTMSFVLPPGRLLSELPRPKDARVQLHEHASRRVAALSFAGRFTREQIGKAARELLARVDEAGFTTRGPVSFAAYDGPTTLPFLRRNEVWVEITEPH